MYDGIFAHELGHHFGLEDYDSDEAFRSATPPHSAMDYGDDNGMYYWSVDDYLKGESYIWYETVDDQTGEPEWDDANYWTDNPWRLGGWQLCSAPIQYQHDGADGGWAGGLNLRIFDMGSQKLP
jgi:hypothetical protein